jgi:hypothetical protein
MFKNVLFIQIIALYTILVPILIQELSFHNSSFTSVVSEVENSNSCKAF